MLNNTPSCCSSVTCEGGLVHKGSTVLIISPLRVTGNPTKLLWDRVGG